MNDLPLDPRMIALGIRQPWAELILRGIKTVEVRSTDTRQRGTIYVYASKKLAENTFAEQAIRRHGLDVGSLPRGQLVGTVDLLATGPAAEEDETAACVPAEYLEGRFAWRLENPTRWLEPVIPRFLPYGVWFYPFRRRNSQTEF
jgi:ASCH domain